MSDGFSRAESSRQSGGQSTYTQSRTHQIRNFPSLEWQPTQRSQNTAAIGTPVSRFAPTPGAPSSNLVDGEIDSETNPPVAPSSIPRPPPREDEEPPAPPVLTLSEQVDDFGWNLVAVIRDFRSHVEDVFTEHHRAMSRAEDAHRLALAKVSAENTQLRERLGLNPGPNLWQNIHFQASSKLIGPNEGKQVKSAEKQLMSDITGSKVTSKEEQKKGPSKVVFGKGKDGDDQGLRRGRGAPAPMANDPQPGGGNWETFVAWVPAGAALEAPQPWKPLPNEAFQPVYAELLKPDDEEEDEDGVGKKWPLLEMWEADKEEIQEARHSVDHQQARFHAMGIVPHSVKSSSPHNSEDSDDIEQSSSRFIMHPYCLPRILWDLASMLMVLYDIIMVPMAFFNLSESVFMDVMTWMTRIFWTLDMGMSLKTGVIMPDGRISFDFRFILIRYLRSWFVLDVFIVTSDWSEFFMSLSQDTDSAGLSNITRGFRIVRSVRLLRLLRMKSVMQAISERIQSDNLFFLLNVMKMTVCIVTFAHIGACIWWGLGKRGGDTWSQTYLEDDVGIEQRYLISLHWTLSQFSGGMEEVRPRAAIERFFVVVMWIVSFMAAASVASILTSSLVQAHIIGGSQARQLSTLRRYLKQNSISKGLGLRVQRSAKHAISGDLNPEAVDLLGVVSDQLRLEMHFEMYSELFRCHPFFDQCIHYCPPCLRRICHQAATTLLLDVGDVIFSKGEAPAEPKMYFLFKGTVEYQAPSGETVTLSERQWIGEPVLWLQWAHRGQLKAVTDVKVARLDARRFQDIMERFKEVFPAGFNPKLYAHDYAKHLNDMDTEQVSDIVTYCPDVSPKQERLGRLKSGVSGIFA